MDGVRRAGKGRDLFAVGLVFAVLTCFHLLALHQGSGWTSPLLVGDHLFDLALALIYLLYGLAIGRLIAKPLLGLNDDALSENLAGLGLGIGSVSLILLGIGLLHLYYGPVFAAAALLLTYIARKQLDAICRETRVAAVTWFRRGIPTAPTHGLRLVLILVVATFVLISPRTSLPPSYNSSAVDLDTISYHLAAPKIYVQAHALVPRSDIPLADAPAGGDILNVLGLIADSDTVGRSLNLLLILMLGLATFAVGRRHFGPDGAWLGALLFLTTSWLIPLAPTIIPDFAAAFLLVVGLSDLLAWANLLIDWRAAGRPQGDNSPPIPSRLFSLHRDDLLLIRAGLLIGFAASFKLTNLPALPAASLIVGMAPLLRGGWTAIARLGHAVRAGALIVAAMVCPLVPWLLKNLYFFGAPFYPINVAVAGSDTPTAAVPPAAVGGASSHFDHLWWIVSTLGTTYWHYISPLSPLLLLIPFIPARKQGSVALLLLLSCGVLALLFVPLFLPPRYWLGQMVIGDAVLAAVFTQLCALIKRRSLRLLFAILLTLDATIWLAGVTLGPTSITGLATAAGGEAAVMIVVVILRSQVRPRPWLELPVTALLCLSTLIAMFVALRESNEHQYFAVADGTLSRQAYLVQNNWYYPAFTWANRNLPSNATIVLVNLVAGYYVDRHYLDDWGGERIGALESGPAARRAELATWCAAGIRYAVFDSNFYYYQPHAYRWTNEPRLAARVLFIGNGVEVLAVSPCAAVR